MFIIKKNFFNAFQLIFIQFNCCIFIVIIFITCLRIIAIVTMFVISHDSISSNCGKNNFFISHDFIFTTCDTPWVSVEVFKALLQYQGFIPFPFQRCPSLTALYCFYPNFLQIVFTFTSNPHHQHLHLLISRQFGPPILNRSPHLNLTCRHGNSNCTDKIWPKDKSDNKKKSH